MKLLDKTNYLVIIVIGEEEEFFKMPDHYSDVMSLDKLNKYYSAKIFQAFDKKS